MNKKTCKDCGCSYNTHYQNGKETPVYCQVCGGSYRERAEILEAVNANLNEKIKQLENNTILQ
jgi:uncharacterized Zn finger protein (UPF0148 family)